MIEIIISSKGDVVINCNDETLAKKLQPIVQKEIDDFNEKLENFISKENNNGKF